MKRIKPLIAGVLCIVMMLSIVCTSSASASRQVGDVNNDGNINGKDVLQLRKSIIGLSELDDTRFADCNGDGNVNGKDVLLLRKYIIGLKVEMATIFDSTTSNVVTTTVPTTIPTTTVPRVTMPDAGVTVPSSYGSGIADNITVNQVGYETNSQKTAKLFEPFEVSSSKSTISLVTFYVVDADYGHVVYQGTTIKRSYNNGTNCYVSEFDFSSVTVEGRYYLHGPSGKSYEFEVCDNPYDEVNDAMLTMLYYQRCGMALDADIVGDYYAHSACHTGDNYPATILNKDNGSTYEASEVKTASDFSGGLHDAGDYGRYTTPAVQTIADLIYTYTMFPEAMNLDIIQDNKGEHISDALDEARYEAEWLLKMQAEDGGVYWRIVTIEFGTYHQPDKDGIFLYGGWTTSVDKSRYGLYVSRTMYEATAGAAGAFASCYVAFKDIDKDFANECLAAAKKAYNWCMQSSLPRGAKSAFDKIGETPKVIAGSYGGTVCNEALWYAACSLYAATGDNTYHSQVKAMASAGCGYTEMGCYNFGGFGSLSYILCDKADETIKNNIISAFKTKADDLKAKAEKNAWDSIYSDGGDYGWGSNADLGQNLKSCAVVDYISGTKEYDSTIRGMISFMLGRNWSGYSFVTGYGTQSPKHPHHRQSWYTDEPVPGMVVGGIYHGSYTDSNQNIQGNEICIYWNTSVTAIMAYVVENDLK
ncbi:MAG: glycoside hydrolase family 9 protein [Clostridia bacterium]|nr:glycoside hydrolase family 9 protein [Clostridia bacterium]